MAVDVIGDVNAKVTSMFTGVNIMNIIGWAIAILLIGGFCIWYFGFFLRDKKMFNKKITAFEIVGINFVPVIRDTAKSVKLGSGGFEVLYLRKLKTWKLAYGGRVGKNDYYFFIMPDGYWYNGMMSANIKAINKDGGLIPIVTTNPTMRSQYTALEKQIDVLHGDKKSFMEKYGVWILGISFVLIAGVMMWLMFKEFSTGMSSFKGVTQSLADLVDKINVMQTNAQIQTPTSGGLTQV